ncbi:MarR family transcriptional regulator [Spongiactinospora sp. TRM90649]|uniref:MarR family winged helix-turn-helix transcriptional regulator n=1 Tax=Spongiactinospora sp. TRM90649 TaxID=3031114 RepID=UPI0023F9B5FC|nr:MarR family transcriptional regulator [Spongiactinospora sp. TRM90649]MDF5754463.1 MarR family transcriptional regulator [Spongiactinospora sp. TRM90649]
MLDETQAYALLQVMKPFRNLIASGLAELDLHAGQEMLLNQLWREDGITQSELIERLGVEPPTVTKTLQRLERAGVVRREPDPGRRRMIRVFLTERGHELREPVEAVWRGAEERMLSGLSDQERAAVATILPKMASSLSAFHPHRPCG